jgi:4-aminobutyrate aminotransferase/(S)-3-amino-2-methylpropionate transaminase
LVKALADDLAARAQYATKGLSLAHPITIERGENALLFDSEGRKYLDFTSGIGVTNLGHCNRELVDAVADQVRKLWHICYMVADYKPYTIVAKELAALAPGSFEKQVLLVNSGAEAVENAIKLARQQSSRYYVLAFENSFHGRTYATMALTGKYEPYKIGFEPFPAGVEFVPYAYCYRCVYKQTYPECGLWCVDYIRRFFFTTRAPSSKIATILAEPIQGEGGFVTPPQGYFKELEKIADENGIILTIDEIQTGFGRTGKVFAIEHWGVEPDMIIVGKGLANGLPLSGVVAKKELMDKVTSGSVGGTYGGNPVACAAAIKAMEIMRRDGIPERAARLGSVMLKRLKEMEEKHEIIGDVRGKGMMLAIELVKNRKTKEPSAEETKMIIEDSRKRGLLLLKAGLYANVIRLHPPITIDEESLTGGLDILESAIAKAAAK